jgi:DNA-binding NtrC family response regulator
LLTVSASHKILLVDDDEDTRVLLGALLTSRGLAVDPVDSAQACLARLSPESECVVATDVQMPGMSGIDLCRVLRAAYPHVVVIVMSGSATPAVAESALQAGAFTFLPKPVSANQLEAVLRLATTALAQGKHRL